MTDYFDDWDPFETLGIENPFDKNPKTIAIDGLLTYNLQQKNKSRLQQILSDHEEDLVKEPTTTKLATRAYIFINNLDSAYKLSEKLEDNKIGGLIAYAKKDYKKATLLFYNSKSLTQNIRILYSLAHNECISEPEKNNKLKIHKNILNPIIKTSDKANAILGTIHFNSKNLNQAEKYFRKAKELLTTETNYLNLLKAQFQNKKQNLVYQNMNKFYMETSSQLCQEKIDAELQKEKIALPKIKIKNLYEIISKLI